MPALSCGKSRENGNQSEQHNCLLSCEDTIILDVKQKASEKGADVFTQRSVCCVKTPQVVKSLLVYFSVELSNVLTFLSNAKRTVCDLL